MRPQEQSQAPEQSPQPMPQPEQQPAMVTPPVGMPMSAAPVVPKKGLSKGALWGIIGGAIGLVLLVVGLVLALTIFGGPSKDDFRKANDKLNDAKTAYNAMSGLQYVSSYGVTETTAKNDLQKIKDAKSKVDTAVDELGKMKAVNDKDVKESYGKIKDKMANFDKAMETGIEVYDKIMPIMVKLNSATDSYSTSSDTLSTMTSVRKDLEALDLKVDVNKTYVSGLVEQIKILEAVIPKKIAMSQDYTKYDSSVNTQYYDAIDKLNSLDKDWQSNLEKVGNDGEINDQLNNLGNLLYDKYLGIKK